MRPMLNACLRRLWRDETTLQVGVDPEHATAITGLDDDLAAAVDWLTGTDDELTLLRRARSRGVPTTRLVRLLRVLGSAGVLDDADHQERLLAGLPPDERARLRPDLTTSELSARVSTDAGTTTDGITGVDAAAAARDAPFGRRRRAHVLVHGAGRVGAAVATLLAGAGVGRVRVVDDTLAGYADVAPAGVEVGQVGNDRASAVHQRIAAIAPSTATGRSERPRPDLVVLAPDDEVDRALAATLISANLPHLVARVRDARGQVGPFVRPGETACLRCLDLHRTDRDPRWPHLLEQLLAESHPSPGCDVVLATAVATVAASHVLAYLEGGAADPIAVPSLDGTVELARDGLACRRRSWAAHPRCGCRADHLAVPDTSLSASPSDSSSDSPSELRDDLVPPATGNPGSLGTMAG